MYYPPGRPDAGRLCDWRLECRWEGLLTVGLGLGLAVGGWAWYRRRAWALAAALGLIVAMIGGSGWACRGGTTVPEIQHAPPGGHG